MLRHSHKKEEIYTRIIGHHRQSQKMLFHAIENTFSETKVVKDGSYWGDFGESQFSVKGLEDGDLGSLDWN